MKKRKVKRVVEGDRRTVKKFILWETLRLDVDSEQTRFLELAEITQIYDGKWVDFCWKQQGGTR